MEKEIIITDYNGHKIIADILPVNSKPQVFCMHGAGKASRERFDSLRKILNENNISSCALDFLGYGETGGDISQSSLQARTEQAKAVIEHINSKKLNVFIGTSMGAYNAIKLTEIYEIGLLVLICPGVYTTEAYQIPFGDNFSSVIRKERSWDATDAWEILKKFKGKVIIVTGSQDEVVPFEIIQKIYDSATNASHREIVILPEASHQLMTIYFPTHPEELQKLADKIVDSLK